MLKVYIALGVAKKKNTLRNSVLEQGLKGK